MPCTRSPVRGSRERGNTKGLCNTVRFDEDAGRGRIEAYAKAGHRIANHSHSHIDLNKVGPDQFLADIDKAATTLSRMQGFVPWFRFPFLREGKTVEDRDKVRAELKRRDLMSGYVTVDTYDWYVDKLFQDGLSAGKKPHFDRLRRLYVKVLSEGVEFYNKIARESLGRSPRHVLLLHENDLAALYISDLIKELRKNGWRIVTPERAYQDPIASQEPDTLFLGQGRVVALAKLAGHPGPFWKWEDEDTLDRLFSEEKVFTNRTVSYNGRR